MDSLTAYSAKFLLDRLKSARRVLDVGCGSGTLAQALLAPGRVLVAIDRSAENVAQARVRGVDARRASVFELDEEPFDAVVFSRSLHHLEKLEASLERAKALLVKGGIAVVEDFVVEAMDQETAGWFFQQLWPGREEPRPLERWRREHFGVHPGAELEAAFRERFAEVRATRGPYLFRYLAQDRRAGHAELQKMFEAEREGIARGRLRPVGLRLTGIRRD